MCELLQWPTRPAAENFLSCMWWPHGYTCTVAQPNKLVVQTRRQAATLLKQTNPYLSPLQTSPTASNRSSPSFQRFQACHFYMGVYFFSLSAIFQFRLLCRRCRSFFTRGSTPCDDWLKVYVSYCFGMRGIGKSDATKALADPGTCSRSQQAARDCLEPFPWGKASKISNPTLPRLVCVWLVVLVSYNHVST